MFKRRKGFFFLIPLSVLSFLVAEYTFNLNIDNVLGQEKEISKNIEIPVSEIATQKTAPVVYGIKTDSLEIVEGKIARGENLSEILASYNISPTTIYDLSQKAKDVYSVRRINANRNYTLLHRQDSAQTAQYFIYEPNDLEYIIYDLRDTLNVTRVKRDMEVVERTLAGTIRGSLYESVLKAGGSAQLVNKLADIYAWRLNLNHIQPGDKFKLIFEEKEVNGTTIGYGQLKAAYFEHRGEPIYAIGFDQGNGLNYFDQDGKNLKKAFLKEPLEYTRISSRFSKRRFHPVQKRYKAHLGTDFAAPRGTPIRSVGEGLVIAATYTRGNGYYVKIKHNKTYTTQYLHMSKFARGIRKGVRVKQGQTIGYVGSTGLATGPHLCYRFWKNGRQVDALKVKLPLAEPIKKKDLAAFEASKAEVVKRLQALDLNNAKQELLATDKGTPVKGA